MTVRPVALNPVITPSAKKAHTTSPPNPRAPSGHRFIFSAANRHHTTSTNNHALPVADQPNLRFEPDAALLFHLVARHVDQRAHFRGLSAAKIHDKICMLIRKCRTAEPGALQPRAFEQLAGEISRRIFEDRSRIRHAARLSRRTLGLQLCDSRRQLRRDRREQARNRRA